MVLWFLILRVFENVKHFLITVPILATYTVTFYFSTHIYWSTIFFSVVGHMIIDVPQDLFRALGHDDRANYGSQRIKLTPIS